MRIYLKTLLVLCFLSNFAVLAQSDRYFYATVENLSVRSQPSLKAKRISSLKEGERVFNLGRRSNKVISVELRGRQTWGPFYLVQTRKGKQGWVYGGALSHFPINVEKYYAVIAFSKSGSIDRNIRRAVEYIRDYTGIDVIFVTRNFKEVNLRNNYGQIIGVENISRIVNENYEGVICLEKGRRSKIINGNYSSSRIEEEIFDYFGDEINQDYED